MLLAVLLPPLHCQNVCVNNKYPRKDCGYFGITQENCQDMDCCWDPQENQPWCFTKTDVGTPNDACQKDSYPRKDCGSVGITEQKCTDLSCCWDPKDNQPWCFTKTSPPPPEPACLPDNPRLDCGFIGVDQTQCEDMGCCWQPADDVPWCFQKSGGTLQSQCKTSGPRFDCGVVGDNEQDCLARSCCWDPAEGQPWCFYQTPVYTVKAVDTTTHGVKMTLEVKNTRPVPYGPNISPLTFELWEETKDRLHFKIWDPNNQRWEVPQSVLPTPPPPVTTPPVTSYSYLLPKIGEEFFITIKRKSNQETIFDTTSVGTLQFANQYLSLGTHLPSGHYIYGIGERKSHLRVTPNGANCGNTYPLWNADVPTIPDNYNLYGSHPFHLDLRKDGLAHGVFLKNSNGMDIQVLDTALQYKVIGGVLDFYVFLGPDPEAVIQQYQEVIGRPTLPLYWSLGFHQCRYGYEHLQDLKDVVNGYVNAEIPLDVIWSDIDYMDEYKDFTLDPNRFPANDVKKFIGDLRTIGMKYVMIVDPGIGIDKGYPAYDRGLQDDVFVKDFNGNNYVGLVWPGKVHYPDFFNPKTVSYWETEFRDFFNNLADVDGIWLDMNEPANFCDGECSKPEIAGSYVRHGYSFNPNDPPYYINNRCYRSPLYTRTVAVDSQHYGNVLEYDAHNLYGMMQSIVTKKVMDAIRPNKRHFILSRANFPGTGAYAVHWNGDNTAHETDLYFSLPMMLSFQLYGIPFVGSDICGFFEDTNEELCARWMQMGAFYPFARNHNFKGPKGQEPYHWDSVAATSRKYLGIRYSLLPYYYTLFFKAHRPVSQSEAPSATVVRPLFFEFPQDKNTYPIDWQFMVGNSLLISPVLRVGDPGKSVSVYFPWGSRWYDWFTHETVSDNGGQHKNIDTPLDVMPIHIRGGVVIPMQDPGLTTGASQSNPFYLLVALDATGDAVGDVFIDDGETYPVVSFTFVEYVVSGGKLTANPSGTGYAVNQPPLDRVIVIGLTKSPSAVNMDGAKVPFSFDHAAQTLTVGPGLRTGMDKKYTISWE